ncbi:hypothetical protein [Aliarcobacter butzleri]|uniref:hypothetical protein n=1 Tax=Aliarcobacter butzleri TaxID=28197 RepID=UPI00263E9CCC|nr:hypothetical protein [Aliarcobacter butzleri]MDN5058241.1 hypothetical protein [Aliarcobacter butzleri]
MEIIKIQINHEKPIFTRDLATILYNQIGEEYDLNEDEIKDYFEILSVMLLPNDTFVTVLTFELPELPTRDIELKDIVLSFLNSVEKIEGVINIIKTQDSILQTKAHEIYKKITDIEMELRNVLTYIICYDEKNINEELFKTFAINKSEKIEYEQISKVYENGLFYIYFNHYSAFSEPEKLKADKILEFLQAPNIDTFDKFKQRLEDRGIKENRHLDFIASIKTKLDPIEKMRNAIMHIRNLSDNLIKNFEMSMNDNGDKGIQSIINDFWINEQNILNQKTALKIVELEIKNIFRNSTFEEEKLVITQDFGDDILSEYESLEDLQNDFISYGNDGLEFNYHLTEGDETYIKEIVKEHWERLSSERN